MATKYIITKTEWDYNDETYFSNGTGGIPVAIFTSKTKAEKEVHRLNMEFARTMEINSFMYFDPSEQDPKLLTALYGRPDTYGEEMILASATDDDIMKFLKKNYIPAGYNLHEIQT